MKAFILGLLLVFALNGVAEATMTRSYTKKNGTHVSSYHRASHNHHHYGSKRSHH